MLTYNLWLNLIIRRRNLTIYNIINYVSKEFSCSCVGVGSIGALCMLPKFISSPGVVLLIAVWYMIINKTVFDLRHPLPKCLAKHSQHPMVCVVQCGVGCTAQFHTTGSDPSPVGNLIEQKVQDSRRLRIVSGRIGFLFTASAWHDESRTAGMVISERILLRLQCSFSKLSKTLLESTWGI